MTTTLHPIIQNSILGTGSAWATMKLGEITVPGEITGNNIWDMVIKITVPIVTGIIAPIVKDWIDDRKKKRKRR